MNRTSEAIVDEVLARLGHMGTAPNMDGRSCATCMSRGQCAALCPKTTIAVVQAGANRIGNAPGRTSETTQDFAPLIDHTILKPDATRQSVEKLLTEAREHVFASVCVNPHWVPLAAEYLRGSKVKVCTVVGFPLGANRTETKAFEARRACYDGAEEIDMVLNVGALKSGDLAGVEKDIRAVVESVGPRAIVKVILETAYLTTEEKVEACRAAKRAGAHYVKTSTGFAPSGATAEDIRLMRSVVGDRMGVKASGGIRNREDAEEMVRAGASRIGASASVAIVAGGSQ